MNPPESWMEALAHRYDAREIQQIYAWAVDEFKYHDHPKPLPDLSEILERLKLGEPIQYILGISWFGDFRLHVNSSVLIPRPETEMIPSIVSEITGWSSLQPIRILDAGTGSGCIAMAMKAKWPKAEVSAWDISAEAVEVAKTNAARYHLDIRFSLQDLLQPAFGDNQLDLLVSNPPYIPMEEWVHLSDHVRNHEPKIALTPPGNDSLIFYKAFVEWAQKQLKPGGWLVAEIHEASGDALRQLWQGLNPDVQIIKDYTGRIRFAAVCVRE